MRLNSSRAGVAIGVVIGIFVYLVAMISLLIAVFITRYRNYVLEVVGDKVSPDSIDTLMVPIRTWIMASWGNIVIVAGCFALVLVGLGVGIYFMFQYRFAKSWDTISNDMEKLITDLPHDMFLQCRQMTVQRRWQCIKDQIERLVHQRDLFAGIVMETPVIICQLDPDGITRFLNGFGQKILGYSESDIIGKHWWKTILAEDMESSNGTLTTKLKVGDTSNMHLTLLSHDNEPIPVIWHSIVDYNKRDKRKHIWGFGFVGFESEPSSSMTSDSNDTLAYERGNTRFVAKVSHAIRTPMNAIVGLVTLLLKTDLSSQQRRYMTKIRDSARELLAVLNSILDFSKLENGQLTLESIDFDLQDVLDNLSELFSEQVMAKELDFNISIQEDVPLKLVGDPVRLEQVLVSLIDNAVKNTQTGQVAIRVMMVEKGIGRIRLQFSVSDTGKGISLSKVSTLFTSDFLQEESDACNQSGLGVSLVIVQKLVRMMSGEMWMETRQGQGTTFHFTADFGLHFDDNSRFYLPSRFYGMRVLVVDDNITSQENLCGILDDLGFDAVAIDSVEQALMALKNARHDHPFELVILDWSMADMDGVGVLETIRSIPDFEELPVIIIMAHGLEDVLQWAEKMAVTGFLIKPVQQSILCDIILHVFDEQKTIKEEASVVEKESKKADLLNALRVLVAEDNLINQQVVKELLEGQGIEVDVVANGKQAVEMVKQNDYDVILMDIQMPVMDGYEATKRIRSLSQGKTIPVIAITAFASKEDQQECYEAGMNDFLTKPIDVQQLFSVLSRWTKSSHLDVGDWEAPLSDAASGEMLSPPDVPGIDVEAGVKRLRGNVALFCKLLSEFVEEYGDAGRRISEAMEKKDKKGVLGLIHIIKGLAGNLSAKSLFKITTELESAIKENNVNDIRELLNRFQVQLSETTHSIQLLNQWIHETSRPEPASPTAAMPEGDQYPLMEKVNDLKTLLSNNNPKAEEFFETLKPHLLQLGSDEEVRQLGKQIGRFQFKNAIMILERIMSG